MPLGSRYMEAAAAVVTLPDCPPRDELLRMLCWTPAEKLSPRLARLATLTWFWVFAAQPSLQVTLPDLHPAAQKVVCCGTR